MSNKHLAQPPTEVALARLKVLFEGINEIYKQGNPAPDSSISRPVNGTMVLESDLVSAYHDALNLFFDSLGSSITKAAGDIYAGAPTDPLNYNIIFAAIRKDLSALFSELGAVDRLVSGSFNSIISEREQVLQASKRISNKLGDYLLYADPSLGGGYFFGDSFNTADRIDVASPLVEGDECYLGSEEGIVLLPFDGEPEVPKVKSIIINKPSNGDKGNNHQIGVVGHAAIETISDGEPNTWFEYEKVTVGESSTPLTLDITIAFEDLSVINHININPINFGTPTPVQILKLETSKDGIEYVSIKDDVPVKDFVVEEEKDEFALSPATAKYSGQGFYSFLPRKAQYVHVLLQQYTPYSIETNNGTRLRYAIGLRDINIFGRKFKPEGSLVSSPFSVNGDARKLSLWASENPTEVSVLADITHSISYDDGAVWHPIQPQGRDSTATPEVINFNTISEGAIETEDPVDALRHKITMKRDPDKFSGEITLTEKKLTQTDIVNAPSGGNFTLTLSESPIKDTVRLVLPFWGSYSCPRPRLGNAIVNESPPMDLDFVEFSIDTPSVDTIRFTLPFENIPGIEEKIRVFLNRAQWEWAGKAPEFLGGVDENSKVYFLENTGGKLELQFGYTDPNGKVFGLIPDAGMKVQVCLDGDNPLLQLTDQGYILTLASPSDGFKENVELVYYDTVHESEAADYVFEDISPENSQQYAGYFNLPEEQKQSFIRVSPPVFISGATNIEMKEYQNGELIPLSHRHYNEPVDFVDGYSELVDIYGALVDGRYSFDPDTQRIYIGSAPLTDRKYSLVVKATNVQAIPVDKWEYFREIVSGKIDTQKIVLDPEYVSTIKRRYDHIHDPTAPVAFIKNESQSHAHDWRRHRFVRGTVIPDKSLFPPDVEPVEVPFVDGRSELLNLVKVDKEPITFSGTGPLYTFSLGEIDANRVLPEGSSLAFASVRDLADSIAEPSRFLKEVTPAVPSDEGEWSIAGDTVTLYTEEGSPHTHTVTYTYENIDSGVDRAGQYSVDYENNAIYFAQNIYSSGSVYFETSAYSAFYNIGELIQEGDIDEIDEEGRSITISSALGMRFLKLDTADKARPAFLKVMYEYYEKSTESLADIEPYFSPICKDIAFRAVTSDILEEL